MLYIYWLDKGVPLPSKSFLPPTAIDPFAQQSKIVAGTTVYDNY